MEMVRGFIFLGSKITADGDCSHEIKRRLLLGRSYEKPRQDIKKQRHYFVEKVLSSQSYDFLAVMYGVRVGLQRKLRAEELMLLNCDVGEDSWESLRLQGDPTSPS